MTIAAILMILPAGPMQAACDVVEVNTLLHRRGGTRFTQVIYWTQQHGRLHVAAWEMLGDHEIYRAGDRWIVCRWGRIVRADRLIFTVSRVDPEVRDRGMIPIENRRGL
jgi:hypothetical protein